MDQNAEKRVALAKDVLAQLDAETVRPMFGAYCMVGALFCETCALGAMVVACCGRPDRSIGADPARVIACLSPLFSIRELAAIEAAFEGTYGMPMVHEARDVERDAGEDTRDFEELIDRAVVTFGKAPPESEEPDEMAERRDAATARVRLLMSNIITHNGTFVPEAL